MPRYDVIVRHGLLFDGNGEPPRTADVGIERGRVHEIAPALSPEHADRIIDARGKWLMPGFIDLHSHVDLEVELSPGLPELVRHGTTTAIASNCSLGICYGAQRRGDENPIVDCFARVENVPKRVLQKIVDRIDWDEPQGYLDHFDRIPLGPNIVPMVPHSMLRIEVMGLRESIARDPTKAELDRMAGLLEDGLRMGYAGFSTDALPFHYLANHPNRKKRIPAQFARFSELRRLTGVVRRYGRVWQATPATDFPLRAFRDFLLSSGRLFGRTLKVTAVAAHDAVTNRRVAPAALFVSRVLNGRLVRGHFVFQVLAAPFRIWSDGPVSPLAETIPELRVLNEPDLEDREARARIYADPEFRRTFKKMWFAGRGRRWSPGRLKLLLIGDENPMPRNLRAITISRAPVSRWRETTMGEVYDRLRTWQRTAGREGPVDDAEAAAFSQWGGAVADEADFFLELLARYDTDLRWHLVVANDRPRVLRQLLFHPLLLPGFNDSSAHITNMAFYDANLRGLKLAQEEGLERVAYHVRRLTREPAELFGLDVGRVEVGARADLIVVDPEALARHDGDAGTRFIFREDFGYEAMVNRSDGVVTHVLIGGKPALADGKATPALGREKLGDVLTVGSSRAR